MHGCFRFHSISFCVIQLFYSKYPVFLEQQTNGNMHFQKLTKKIWFGFLGGDLLGTSGWPKLQEIFLPQPPQCWSYRPVPSHLAANFASHIKYYSVKSYKSTMLSESFRKERMREMFCEETATPSNLDPADLLHAAPAQLLTPHP